MLILAADTSLPILSIALVRDGALIGAMAMEGKGSRNEKLLPAIDWVLSENAIDRRTIDLLAVTRGPGSFTGVRIGLATMQGLALALVRPVCAMSTHEAIAWSEEGRVAIVDDAGRGELYVSVFDGVEIEAPHLVPGVLVSSVLASSVDVERRVIRVADFLERDNVALRCARRALEIEARGEGERYRDVTPIYVRLAEADVKLREKLKA